MEFKHLDDLKLRHYLNESLNKALAYEQIKIKGEELEHSLSLEIEYTKLLDAFEEHIKDIIATNKNL